MLRDSRANDNAKIIGPAYHREKYNGLSLMLYLTETFHRYLTPVSSSEVVQYLGQAPCTQLFSSSMSQEIDRHRPWLPVNISERCTHVDGDCLNTSTPSPPPPSPFPLGQALAEDIRPRGRKWLDDVVCVFPARKQGKKAVAQNAPAGGLSSVFGSKTLEIQLLSKKGPK